MTLSAPFDPKLVIPLYRVPKHDLSLLATTLSEPFDPTLGVYLSRLFTSSELLRLSVL